MVDINKEYEKFFNQLIVLKKKQAQLIKHYREKLEKRKLQLLRDSNDSGPKSTSL